MFIILQIFFATSGISQSVICQHVKVCQLASKTASFNIHFQYEVDFLVFSGTALSTCRFISSFVTKAKIGEYHWGISSDIPQF